MHRPRLNLFGNSRLTQMILQAAMAMAPSMGSKHQLGPGKPSILVTHSHLAKRTRYNNEEVRRLRAERGVGAVKNIDQKVRASFWPTKRA